MLARQIGQLPGSESDCVSKIRWRVRKTPNVDIWPLHAGAHTCRHSHRHICPHPFQHVCPNYLSCQFDTTYNLLKRSLSWEIIQNTLAHGSVCWWLTCILIVVIPSLYRGKLGYTTSWDDHEPMREPICSITKCLLPPCSCLESLPWFLTMMNCELEVSAEIWNKLFLCKLFLAMVFIQQHKGN